jgi:biuret amidohydrolase
MHTREGHRSDFADLPENKRWRSQQIGARIGDRGPMGRILIVGEPGNAIIPELTPSPGEIVLEKPGKGAFCRTNLDTILQQKEITHLMITGVTTEVCVQTTMREANDRGYECLLVKDATESYFPEFKQATLSMVRAQGGIIGWTAMAEAIHKAINV